MSRKRAGTTVRCPACQTPTKVPGQAVVPPPVPPPATPSPAVESDAPPQLAERDEKTARRECRAKLLPSDQPGYRADVGRRRMVYQLAAAMGAVALFSIYPALGQWYLPTAPGWAQAIVLLALVQLAYAVWLALAPDWSTVWVAMFSLAALAAVYATGMAICMNVQPGGDAILGIGELNRTAGNRPTLWCGAVTLLAALLAYLSGTISYRWRKAYRAHFGVA